jgi:hypothetical protein
VVILLMPSDIIIMLTVATNLEQTGSSFAEALPFIGLTVLVAVLPRSRFFSSTAVRSGRCRWSGTGCATRRRRST